MERPKSSTARLGPVDSPRSTRRARRSRRGIEIEKNLSILGRRSLLYFDDFFSAFSPRARRSLRWNGFLGLAATKRLKRAGRGDRRGKRILARRGASLSKTPSILPCVPGCQDAKFDRACMGTWHAGAFRPLNHYILPCVPGCQDLARMGILARMVVAPSNSPTGGRL
jgi:hypothetical protein